MNVHDALALAKSAVTAQPNRPATAPFAPATS